ncbi:MAG: hypothetical protein IKY58_04420, partial [Paludibacteraceae bacterium]|nr:hypothetical protein [Paludibacteraceae bacterium]
MKKFKHLIFVLIEFGLIGCSTPNSNSTETVSNSVDTTTARIVTIDSIQTTPIDTLSTKAIEVAEV